MNAEVVRLEKLCVADAMSCDVVTVSANQTLAEATQRLANHGLSGAPVVDEMGRCVGMLTGSNVVHGKARSDAAVGAGEAPEVELVHKGAEAPYQIEASPSDLVSKHMCAAVQTIAESATLLTAAREMCAEGIHRLPVLDEGGRVVGVLTALDVLRHVAPGLCGQGGKR